LLKRTGVVPIRMRLPFLSLA